MTTETVRLDLPVLGQCVAWPRPLESGLDLYEAASMRRWAGSVSAELNLSPTRPTGVAQTAERGLVAVATPLGSVHLIAIRPGPDQGPRIATSAAGARTRRRTSAHRTLTENN